MKNKYEKDNFSKIIKESKSITECIIKLEISNAGDNRKTIKKYINLYELNISHFVKQTHSVKKIDLNDILVEHSTYKRSALKERLYKNGLKKRECELCGQGELWNGKKMSLILDHGNGVPDDNRLENLRIVCPNCNATLDTHCGKNNSKKNKKKVEYGFSVSDEIDFREINTKERIISNFNRRKVKDRPTKDILQVEVVEFGYTGVGKKYGVSDNCVRKWLK